MDGWRDGSNTTKQKKKHETKQTRVFKYFVKNEKKKHDKYARIYFV